MMALLKFEIQKILKWKGIYAAAALVILINVLYVWSNKPSLSNYRGSYKYYKVQEGYVTDEKVKIAEEGSRELEKLHRDGIRFDEKNLGKSILYRDIGTVVTQRNEYNKLISNLENSPANSSKEKFMLRTLINVGPIDSAYYTEGWKQIIRFLSSVGYYFTAMMVLLGSSLIIPQEYSSGMYRIVNSTKEGKRKLILAKIGSVIVFAWIVTIFFAGVNILANWYIYGLAGWNAPLKNLYFETPYKLRIWQFYIMQQLFHAFILSILGLMTMLISTFLKNSFTSLSLGGVIFIIIDQISIAFRSKAQQGSIGFIIGNAINLKDFFQSYKNLYSVFGFLVQYEIVLAVVILLLLAFIMGIVYIFCRKFKYAY